MARAPRVTTQPGRLVVLSGPSGVGKDTVLHELRRLDPALRYSVSYTTRDPRPGEQDGVSYSFVDDQTFHDMAERGEFLEWAEVHGNLYGTPAARTSCSRSTCRVPRGSGPASRARSSSSCCPRPRTSSAAAWWRGTPRTRRQSSFGCAPPSPSWPRERRTITAWSTTTSSTPPARSSTSSGRAGSRSAGERPPQRRRPRLRQRRRLQGV